MPTRFKINCSLAFSLKAVCPLDNLLHSNKAKSFMHNFHGHENYAWLTLLSLNKGNNRKFVEYSIEIFINFDFISQEDRLPLDLLFIKSERIHLYTFDLVFLVFIPRCWGVCILNLRSSHWIDVVGSKTTTMAMYRVYTQSLNWRLNSQCLRFIDRMHAADL